MRKNDQGLLGDIENEVLDDTKSLASALRKCVVLGGRANSAALRDWATRELRGYPPGDEVPAYREVAAPIQLDAMLPGWKVSGHRISPGQLPDVMREHVNETVRLHTSIGEIEALIDGAERSGQNAVRLSLPGGADVARMMNYEVGEPYQSITNVYWSVSTAALRGVVGQIRTTLAELVAELRASMPPDQQVPTSEVATQAVNVAVNGHRPQVTVTTAQASEGAQSSVQAPDGDAKPRLGFWTRWRLIGAFVVGLATVIATLVTVFQFLGAR